MRWALLLRLAFRNLTRNKRRNLISCVAIFAGVFSMVIGDGLIEGIDESVIRSQETVLGGDIVMRPTGYPTDGRNYPLQKTLSPDSHIKELLNSKDIQSWTTRLFFRARIIKGSDSIRAKVIAYEKDREATVFNQNDWFIEGIWPSKDKEVVVGSNFAALMNLHIGDHIIIEAKSKPGALNALSFSVVGIVNAGNTRADSFTVWMPLSQADSFIQSAGARSHISLKLKSGRSTASTVANTLSQNGWIAKTATEEVSDLLEVNKFRRKAFSFLSLIIMGIAATGIMNTIIMATYERITEVGTLRSMGMKNNEVIGLFLIEASLLGIFSGLIGGLTGAGLNYVLSIKGIDFSSQLN